MIISEVYSKLTAIKYLRELPNTVESDSEGNRYLTLTESKSIVDKIAEITASNLPTPAVPTFDYTLANEKMYVALDAINAVAVMRCHELNVSTASSLHGDLAKASKAITNILKTLSTIRGY